MSMKDEVANLVQDIFDKNGGVCASDLVEAARPEDSPAHAAFEWDNNIAGHEYRLHQARQWLRVVTVTFDAQPERLVHVPSIIEEREGVYKPISVVVSDRDEYLRAMSAVLTRLESARAAVVELESANTGKRKSIAANVMRHIHKAIEAGAAAH